MLANTKILLFSAIILCSCQEEEIRSLENRPSDDGSVEPDYELETIEFIAAGEAKTIRVARSRTTVVS